MVVRERIGLLRVLGFELVCNCVVVCVFFLTQIIHRSYVLLEVVVLNDIYFFLG